MLKISLTFKNNFNFAGKYFEIYRIWNAKFSRYDF